MVHSTSSSPNATTSACSARRSSTQPAFHCGFAPLHPHSSFFDTLPEVERVIVAAPNFAAPRFLDPMRKHGSVKGLILLPAETPLALGFAAATGPTSTGVSALAPHLLSLAPGSGGGETAADSGVQYVQHPWVLNATGLASTFYSIPMVAVSGSTAQDVLAKARENRKRGADAYPAHAVRMWFPMGPGTLDSSGCLQEGTCDYMGGQTVWASSTPLWANFTDQVQEPNKRQYIMAVAAADALAQFHDLAFGADAAASGVVAVIAAASALGEGHRQGRWNLTQLPLGMLWGAFQGEQLGRLGSRQWVQDVETFTCEPDRLKWGNASPTGKPLCLNPVRTDMAFQAVGNVSNIVHAIAVQQVGTPRLPGQVDPPFTPPALGMYANGLAATAPARSSAPAFLQAVLQGAGQSLATSVGVSSVQAVPPSPLDALRAKSSFVNGAVLTRSVGGTFTNAFYGSELDGPDNINATAGAPVSAQWLSRTVPLYSPPHPSPLSRAVEEAANVLARSMFALATGESNATAALAMIPSSLKVDTSLVQQLVEVR